MGGVPEGGDVADDSQFEDPEKMTAEEKSEVDSKVKEALDYNYQTCEVELEKAEAAALETESMEDDESSENLKKEVSELQELIQEIKEKVDDHHEIKASKK